MHTFCDYNIECKPTTKYLIWMNSTQLLIRHSCVHGGYRKAEISWSTITSTGAGDSWYNAPVADNATWCGLHLTLYGGETYLGNLPTEFVAYFFPCIKTIFFVEFEELKGYTFSNRIYNFKRFILHKIINISRKDFCGVLRNVSEKKQI